MNWSPGQVVGAYHIKRVFDWGGMGTVYHAYHHNWQIDLAIKVIKSSHASDPRRLSQFEFEAETWANIGLHPYVATCYFTKRIQGSLCIFAEFVECGSLQDWIGSRTLYQAEAAGVVSTILQVAAGIASGLDWAHRHSLVHQDVKPDNVLITSDGSPKIADFGLARALNSDGKAQKAGCTRPYAAPEQLTGTTVSPASDVWSWAATVLHMFMGEVLWESGIAIPSAFASYCAQHRRMPGLPQMPQLVADLLAHCFNADPSNRPANCLSLAHSLSKIHSQLYGQPIELADCETLELAIASLNNRAVSLLEVGRESEALVLLERALRQSPDHPEAKHNIHVLVNRQMPHGSGPGHYLLTFPKSGAEHHHETVRLNRLVSKASNALEIGDADEARRYLRMAMDIDDYASHPKLRGLAVRLGLM